MQVFSSDRILWFGVYASFVHKMMAYTFTTYYWLYLVSWVEEVPQPVTELIDGELVEVEIADPEDYFTNQDAIDLFGFSMQVGMCCALVAMPLFGYLNDKKTIDRQIVFVYLIRCFASLLFFFLKDPESPLVWVASIMTIVGANLEGLTAYAFWVKRMPKDIRAILNGYFNSIARTGQLVVSLSAHVMLTNYSIQSLFLLVAIGDFSIVMCSFFLSGTNVFSNDAVEGKAGKDAHADAKKRK